MQLWTFYRSLETMLVLALLPLQDFSCVYGFLAQHIYMKYVIWVLERKNCVSTLRNQLIICVLYGTQIRSFFCSSIHMWTLYPMAWNKPKNPCVSCGGSSILSITIEYLLNYASKAVISKHTNPTIDSRLFRGWLVLRVAPDLWPAKGAVLDLWWVFESPRLLGSASGDLVNSQLAINPTKTRIKDTLRKESSILTWLRQEITLSWYKLDEWEKFSWIYFRIYVWKSNYNFDNLWTSIVKLIFVLNMGLKLNWILLLLLKQIARLLHECLEARVRTNLYAVCLRIVWMLVCAHCLLAVSNTSQYVSQLKREAPQHLRAEEATSCSRTAYYLFLSHVLWLILHKDYVLLRRVQ